MRWREASIGFEDELAGLDPVFFGVELGGVEDDLGVLLFEGVEISSGFAAFVVDGVGAIDGADLERVVLGGGHVARGTVALSEGHFHGFDFFVVPGFGDVGVEGGLLRGWCGDGKEGESDGAGKDFHGAPLWDS